MAEQELKADAVARCPFCGGEADRSLGQKANGTPWPYMECFECGACAEPEYWNTRPLEQALTSRLASAEAEVERLLSALNWALGVGDEFPIRKEGQGAYWWRTELSRRAGLEYDGTRYIISAAARRQQGGTA